MIDCKKMSLEIIIKSLEPQDCQQFSDFLVENNRPEITEHFTPFPLDRDTGYKISCVKTKDYYCIALKDNKIIGFGMLRGWQEGFPIPSLGLVTDYRYHNLGVGRKIVEFLIEQARGFDCKSIILSVYASNLKARKLYLSIGFEDIEKQDIIINGRKDSKIIMRKDL